MADGSFALLRSRRLSMVPSVADAISAIGISITFDYLDGKHPADVLRLAFADARTTVDSP